MAGGRSASRSFRKAVGGGALAGLVLGVASPPGLQFPHPPHLPLPLGVLEFLVLTPAFRDPHLEGFYLQNCYFNMICLLFLFQRKTRARTPARACCQQDAHTLTRPQHPRCGAWPRGSVTAGPGPTQSTLSPDPWAWASASSGCTTRARQHPGPQAQSSFAQNAICLSGLRRIATPAQPHPVGPHQQALG